MVLAVTAILAAIATPSFTAYVQQGRVSAAVSDIMEIAAAIKRYRSSHDDELPPDLAALGFTKLDPWGHPYVYLPFDGLKGKGAMRKNKNLVPINTEFDLYSLGADGKSKPPLTAAASQDDVIYANDGGYIGLASKY